MSALTDHEKKNILITGTPGIGKTTLVKRLSENLRHLRIAGFYTEEIRTRGVREGFALVSFDGRKGILSHVDIRSRYRVGKYGVDVARFEEFLDTISLLSHESEIVIIDEIGKMECFSRKFTRLLNDVLDSEKPVIATISLKGGGVIEEVKNRRDVALFTLTTGNRNSLQNDIVSLIT